MTPEDLYRFQSIQSCELSPDGETAIFGLQRIDRKSEKKYANLWIVPTRTGRPRQFTYGDHVDSAPVWSPDGRDIAFVSNRADERQPQIHVLPFSGGEARPLTDLAGQIGSFSWSPNGKRLAFAFRKEDAAVIDREADETKRELGIVVRHIDRLRYKMNGEGYYPDERWQIWTVDTRSGRTVQLTDQSKHHSFDPVWSPDGKRILFNSNRSQDPDLNPEAVDLWTIDAGGGRARRIPTTPGIKAGARFSPDGKTIAYIGRPEGYNVWENSRVYVVPANGRTKPKDLTGAHDIHVGDGTLGDIGDEGMRPPLWSTDGSRITFQISRHGTTQLVSIDTDGNDLRSVIDTDGMTGSFSFDRDQRRVAWVGGDFFDPGQIIVTDTDSGAQKRLTRFNDTWLNRVDLGELEEVWVKGADRNDLQGWVLKPPGFRSNRKYPSILEIHGGPLAQYGNRMMHEFLFLAAQGYVVHFTNPRGGQGYGEAHAKAIENDWGNKDYADLMAWTNTIARKPYIDTTRMGVTGGSYGGFSTCWIVSHTHRFKAAVTQRCVSNLISMYGSSDINWSMERLMGTGTAPWDDFENHWRLSPMKYVGNVQTPTLVIHSEQDLRCDLEQGEQFYVALKRRGIDTEFVVFPEENHELSRAGRTDRRVERLKHIARWFDKYL